VRCWCTPRSTEQAYTDSATGAPDFRPLLAGVAPVIDAADLAFCHLEVPLAEPEGRRGAPSSPRFTETIERTDEVVASRGATGAGLVRPGR